MARRRRGGQLDRILRLIRKFSYARAGVSIPELMTEFKASRRTVYRDIELLRRNGFRFERAGDGAEARSWLFTPGQRKEIGSTFGEAELMSLYFCMNLLSPLKGTPLRQGLESVLAKIESSFGPRDRDYYGDLLVTHLAKLGPAKNYARFSATLAAISHACLGKKKVSLTYRASADEKPKSYLFHPWCLAYASAEFYTIGWSELRKAVRTLRIDRIERCNATTTGFDRPRDFDPEDYLGRGFGMYAEGEVTRVKIEFSGPAARTVKEKEFHPTQRVDDRPGGKAMLTMQVQGVYEVARWVLSHAPYAKVVEPDELRAMVKEMAAAAAKNHN